MKLLFKVAIVHETSDTFMIGGDSPWLDGNFDNKTVEFHFPHRAPLRVQTNYVHVNRELGAPEGAIMFSIKKFDLSGNAISKTDIPLGTEVWLIADPS